MPEAFGWMYVPEANMLAVDEEGSFHVLYAWELPCGAVYQTIENLNLGMRRIEVEKVLKDVRRARRSGNHVKTLDVNAGGHSMGVTSNASLEQFLAEFFGKGGLSRD